MQISLSRGKSTNTNLTIIAVFYKYGPGGPLGPTGPTWACMYEKGSGDGPFWPPCDVWT